MGSRRRRYAALVVGCALASCTAGAPRGFAPGTSWAIPLIGPLEDGLLLVPALVNGKGPFVFAIDTDARVSSVDQDVVLELAPRTGEGPALVDESGIERDRFYAEILEWQLGTLTVTNKPAQIVPAHVFDREGRRIHGVIGRDILTDALTFSFNREGGELVLTVPASKPPAPAALRIGYTALANQSTNVETPPLPRRVVDATIGDRHVRMHVDFGATASQLRPSGWASSGLVESELEGIVVDEVGMPRHVTRQGIANSVRVGDVVANNVAFIPYGDKRWPEPALDGTLGLDFFKPYSVAVDWQNQTLDLRPRAGLDNLVARIGRWQSNTLSGCANTGCVTIRLIDSVANIPVDQRPAIHPGVVVSVTREQSSLPLDLEVLVAVTAADGKTPLKWLLVNMPAGTERTLGHLSADYVGATTTILDASPFPRPCPDKGGCVDLLAPP